MTGNGTLTPPSMAFQPMLQNEHWGLFMGRCPRPGVIKHLALNIGAPGGRRDRNGTLWLAMPRPPMQKWIGQKIDARALVFEQDSVVLAFGNKVRIPTKTRSWLDRPLTSWPCGHSDFYRAPSLYRLNADRVGVAGGQPPWVYTSGNRGPLAIRIDVSRMPKGTKFRARLHFAEPDEVNRGDRMFDVAIGDRSVLRNFDIIREAGERFKAVVREFEVTATEGALAIALTPKRGEPRADELGARGCSRQAPA